MVGHKIRAGDCGARWHSVGRYALEEVGVEESFEGVVGGGEGQAESDKVSDMSKVFSARR